MANKEKQTEEQTPAVYGPLRYVGDGEYIPGVPARDLTAEEAERFSRAIMATAAATGRALYQSKAQEG